MVKPTVESLRRVGDASSLLVPVTAEYTERLSPQPLVIGGETIPPGKRVRLNLPVARLTTDTMMSLPVTVINGKQPGPSTLTQPHCCVATGLGRVKVLGLALWT